MAQPGRLITLEGGEGAGKSTQVRRLTDTLAGRGLAVLRTREPGGAPGAERLRQLLLDGSEAWSPLSETLLHFAARAEHVAKTIRPAIDAGMWVVCDRFYDSTLAYQGYGQQADLAHIHTLSRMMGIVPDMTFILDIPADLGMERARSRGAMSDRYERRGASFHARVNAGFRDIARAEPERCVLIDASREPEAVQADLMRALASRGWSPHLPD